jgi:hypothetical protein
MRNLVARIAAALGQLGSPIKLLLGFALALAIAYLAPGAGPIRALAIVAALSAIAGSVIFGLTFWRDARIQIGRRRLRYRNVRQVAGITALSG